MKELLKKILVNNKVKNVIREISSKEYKYLSFKEKMNIYKKFNNIIASILDTDLDLYVNKEVNKNLYRSTTLYDQSQKLVINGLEKNPYIYIKDIITYHLIYIFGECLPDLEVGDVKYNGNYIESECNIILYNKENIAIIEKVAKLMEDLLSGYDNDYVKGLKKDFDFNITKEAKSDLLKANKLFDEGMRAGFYNRLKKVEELVTNSLILPKNEITRDALAMLSLDEIVLHVLVNLYDSNIELIDKHFKSFIDEFFVEFKDVIKISAHDRGLYINNHQLNEFENFIDALFKEINIANKKHNIINDSNTNKKDEYDALESYFLSKLEELDSCLQNKNLEVVNYVKWASVFKEHERNIFDDQLDIFYSLSEDEEFLSLVKHYLNGKKSNNDSITKIFNYLNKVYFDADFKLTIDDSYGDETYGHAGKNNLVICVKNNYDKFAILTTLFHEYRHLVQERESEENHHLYNKKIYSMIKYNNKLSEFNVPYSYFENEGYGYDNQFYYAMQPSEYDAEYFSYKLSKAIFSKLKTKVTYQEYFPLIYINNKYISPQKLAVHSYANYLKIDEVAESYDTDKKHREELDLLMEQLETEEDAIKLIKHCRFNFLKEEEKEKFFKVIAGKDIKVKYDSKKLIMQINNTNIDISTNDDYTIIENILLLKGLSLVKENELKYSELDDYVFNEFKKYKPEEYNLYNILTAFYYHRVISKYEKNRKNKSKNVRSN